MPIRNINYRENSAQPNVNSGTSDVADDKLSRRFFLFDKVCYPRTASEPRRAPHTPVFTPCSFLVLYAVCVCRCLAWNVRARHLQSCDLRSG